MCCSTRCRRCGGLHRMHHADLDIDVTTGLRFHPIEIVLSILIKFAVVAVLGAPAMRRADLRGSAQRHLDVQPQQRAHTSGIRSRAALVCGDTRYAPGPPLDPVARDQQQFRLQPALVGSSCSAPTAPSPRQAMRHDHRHRAVPRFPRARLDRMLLQPFRGDAGRYPIGHREADR